MMLNLLKISSIKSIYFINVQMSYKKMLLKNINCEKH
jgi:hypothetical protein